MRESLIDRRKGWSCGAPPRGASHVKLIWGKIFVLAYYCGGGSYQSFSVSAARMPPSAPLLRSSPLVLWRGQNTLDQLFPDRFEMLVRVNWAFFFPPRGEDGVMV